MSVAGSGAETLVTGFAFDGEGGVRPLCWDGGRALRVGDGILLNLRGVDLNRGKVIDDMVSIRLRISEHLVGSVRRRPLMAVQDTVEELKARRGACTPVGLVAGLLGINVGGMPGADPGEAFWIVTAALVTLGLGLWLLFRRKKWL